MEAVEMIRLARPVVADATPDEFGAIRASFERKSVEPDNNGLWARLRRLTRRQAIVAVILAALVPAGTVAVAEILREPDRSDQLEQALPLLGPIRVQQKHVEGLVEGCRALVADGGHSKLCTDLLREIDQNGGEYVPDGQAPVIPGAAPEP